MKQRDALHEAVRGGDLDSIRRLLDENPELVNERNDLGQGAVLLGKYHRQQAAVDLLIERGAELNIYEAAAVGDSGRVQQWLGDDAGLLNSFSKDGFSPLALAAFFGNAEVANDLIARGADVNAASQNPMGVRPLHSAAAGRHLEIVRALIAAGANVKATQQQGYTALHSAANNGDAEMVRFLLAHEADRDARSAGGQTPLDLAMTQGHAEVAHLLGEDGQSASAAR